MWGWSLDQEDPLEGKMPTHFGILAGIIPWREKSGGLQPLGLQRVRHDWATEHTQAIPYSVTRAVFEKTYTKLCHFQPEHIPMVILPNTDWDSNPAWTHCLFIEITHLASGFNEAWVVSCCRCLFFFFNWLHWILVVALTCGTSIFPDACVI